MKAKYPEPCKYDKYQRLTKDNLYPGLTYFYYGSVIIRKYPGTDCNEIRLGAEHFNTVYSNSDIQFVTKLIKAGNAYYDPAQLTSPKDLKVFWGKHPLPIRLSFPSIKRWSSQGYNIRLLFPYELVLYEEPQFSSYKEIMRRDLEAMIIKYHPNTKVTRIVEYAHGVFFQGLYTNESHRNVVIGGWMDNHKIKKNLEEMYPMKRNKYFYFYRINSNYGEVTFLNVQLNKPEKWKHHLKRRQVKQLLNQPETDEQKAGIEYTGQGFKKKTRGSFITGHIVQDLPDLAKAQEIIRTKYSHLHIYELDVAKVAVPEDTHMLYRYTTPEDPLAEYLYTTDKLTAVTGKILNAYKITPDNKLIPTPYKAPDDLLLSPIEKVRINMQKDGPVTRKRRKTLVRTYIKTYIVHYYDNRAGTNLTMDVRARTLKSLFRKLKKKYRINPIKVNWIRSRLNPSVDLYVKHRKPVHIKPPQVKRDRKICIKKEVAWSEHGIPTRYVYKRVWASEVLTQYSTHEWSYTSKSAYKKNVPKVKPGKTYVIDTYPIEIALRRDVLHKKKLPLYRKLNSGVSSQEEYDNIIDQMIQLTNEVRTSCAINTPIVKLIETSELRDYKHNASPISFKRDKDEMQWKKTRRKLKHLRKNYVYPVNRKKTKRKKLKRETSSTHKRNYRNNYSYQWMLLDGELQLSKRIKNVDAIHVSTQ